LDVEGGAFGEKGFFSHSIMEPTEIGGPAGVLQRDAEEEFAKQAGMPVLPPAEAQDLLLQVDRGQGQEGLEVGIRSGERYSVE
jgi:hypothetical protein